MMKQLSVAVFLIAVLGLSSTCFSQGETLKGYFITRDGKTQIVNEFLEIKGENTFYCRYEGNVINIPFSEIKSITYLGNEISIVKKRNGKEFKVSGRPYVKSYKFYDEINDKYSKNGYDVPKQIVFDDDYGEFRKCQKCGKTFLPDYLFCPYDKTPLNLITLQQKTSSSLQNQNEGLNNTRSQNPYTDASSAKVQSQDKKMTKEGELAVQYAKDVLNPLVPNQKVLQNVHEIADHVVNQKTDQPSYGR